MAYAGWVGMFITSFNLVPLGQLDGGHVAYTLFGERFNKVAWVLLLGLIALGVMAFPGWLVLVLFLLFTGHEHPPVTQGRTLRGGDRAAAWGALALFALTFVPRPFAMPTLLDWLRG
jgi:membrane-associated protease RseP (regulator of RpoE activity)